MPAKKRKKWVQFVKQVEHVQDSKRGTLTQVFNDQASTGVISPLTAQDGVQQHYMEVLEQPRVLM